MVFEPKGYLGGAGDRSQSAIGKPIFIRRFQPGIDDYAALTDLLHLAYADLREMGLRFTATDQGVDVTRRRVEEGECWVACQDDAFVGTICGYRPDAQDPVLYYRLPDVAHFGQFGVLPEFQGKGLGTKLLETVVVWAQSGGYRKLALDTSDEADHLIRRYRAWGFEVVDTHDWRPGTNYTSIVMAKPI